MAEKKIGKNTFSCDKMPATEATEWAFRLGRAAAPLLDKIGSIVKDAQKGDTDDATLKALANFLAQLNPAEGRTIVVSMAEKAQVKQPQGHFEPVVFDAVFNDNLLEAFQVAAWVIQVNFKDFFGGGLGNMFKA